MSEEGVGLLERPTVPKEGVGVESVFNAGKNDPPLQPPPDITPEDVQETLADFGKAPPKKEPHKIHPLKKFGRAVLRAIENRITTPPVHNTDISSADMLEQQPPVKNTESTN